MTDLSKFLLGQQVGSYQVNAKLGEGYFGLVFDATDLRSNKRVALKVLKPGTTDPDAVRDFANEGKLLAKLRSCSGVIGHDGSGTHTIEATLPGGIKLPIAMSYHVLAIASGSLDEISDDPVTRGRLDIIDLFKLWRSAARSLLQMHQNGVAHRDLKCSNCLLLVNRSGTAIQFGDLGRAKDLTLPPLHSQREYAQGRGDLSHAPPEAIFWQGKDIPASFLAADYYGLASILVELLTGASLTRLAISDLGAALRQGQSDFASSTQRDLGVFKQRYSYIVGTVVDTLPSIIQADVRPMLLALAQPEPEKRLITTPFRKDRKSKERLHWILRRIDIVIHRLEIERRRVLKAERKAA